MTNALEHFSPYVRAWFTTSFGEPTPPQREGWPPIQRGEHTLILAPTGSGKTLAAFLWGIDEIYRELAENEVGVEDGVRLLYISPLKALNNDVERNLRVPLEGIHSTAHHMGRKLPMLRVAVRTGDTPTSARVNMARTPPHILITTPESLYLILTSPRAREMFRSVRSVIVDEIHTLCGNKRGVHLALSLERLEHLAGRPLQRIGLSATQKPLEEVARFLGGQIHRATGGVELADQDQLQERETVAGMTPRPVTIVNTGYKKPLDLQVVTVVKDFQDLPADAIWPSIIPRVLQDVLRHQSTLVFCNNRRLAERTADRLNAQIEAERSEEIPPGSTEALAPGGISRDKGMFAIGASGPIRAHHGSMSKEARRDMEEQLKAGRLPALVGTSSLELGIDIGAVDMVVQLQSPKSVSQGLQRVGRSGHLVGQQSVGRIYTTFREDLAEAAAIARGMLDGDVEPTYTPRNPLDVLAQQIVAAVSVEDWRVSDLFNMVRQAYPYEDLSESSYRLVLDMLSGKYDAATAVPRQSDDFAEARQARPPSLRARISWDRVNGRLTALPGSRFVAMSNAGTIPDTGAYGVYLADGQTKVGELDEEFIFETRAGDVFLLGSHVWRVLDIANDRIVVGDAAGAVPRMPFWNGDYPWRPYELGERIGQFRREVAEKIAALKTAHAAPAEEGQTPLEWPELSAWLQREYALDENSARNLISYVSGQLDAVGVMSSDTSIVVETFQDAVGEPRMVIHTPFGGRVNGAWALALSDAFGERFGVEVETQTNDDGILFHFPRTNREMPLDIVQQMTPAEARERILHQLPASELFGAHFRMNATRALLLPKARGAKRTPFWLQRLKARSLLAMVRQFQDFPIIVETYRDCLRDVLDMPHLEQLLSRIQTGEVRVVPIETITPSPVAAGLLYNFVKVNMYEWDAPKAERQLQALSLRRDLIEDVLKGVELRDLLKPEAIADVTARLQHTAEGYQARVAEELAITLHELGDLSTAEAQLRVVDPASASTWLEQLASQGRIRRMTVNTPASQDVRWVPVDYAGDFESRKPWQGEVANRVLLRMLRTNGPLTRDDILARYPFDGAWLNETLLQLVTAREVVKGRFTTGGAADEFVDRHNLEQIHHRTLTLLRKEIQPVSLYAYTDFMTRWQHVHPLERLQGLDGLRRVLNELRGLALPSQTWERDIFPARLADYTPANLDALCQAGEVVWVGSGKDPKRGRLRFVVRGEGRLFLDEPAEQPIDDNDVLSGDAQAILGYLKSEGASFYADIQAGTGLRAEPINGALAELVMAGLVTNDTLDALHAVLELRQEERRTETDRMHQPVSSLQSELAERLHKPDAPTQSLGRRLRPSRVVMREAQKRVTERLRSGGAAPSSAEPAGLRSGRWSLVYRAAVLGPSISPTERVERLARILLSRYGIVTKECLAGEEGAVDWGSLYQVLQLMEMRGEVRRGYFVNGLPGVQFALPEAVEKLRVTSAALDDAILVVSAADPVNLFGGELPDSPKSASGEPLLFARVPSTHCVLWQGKPVLLAEDNGERMTTLHEAGSDIVQRAVKAYIGRPGAPRRIVINKWNGKPALGSAAQAWLQPMGFSRTPAGLEHWQD
ncbi:MAG: DEAD/DEAH box helicase [Chloroflexi bacterium]|nr:DEAD/DEAH box helicase [Chloroflexota bacterium]